MKVHVLPGLVLVLISGAAVGRGLAAAADPGTRDALASQARSLLREGRVVQARETFERILETRSGDAEARFNLAGLALDAGDPEGALRHYEALLDHPEEASEARYNIALVLTDQGQTHRAAAEMARVVQARPDYAEARLRLAQLLEALGDPSGATIHYREAAAIVPEDPDPVAGLARLAEARGEPEAALELYLQALERDPRHHRSAEAAGDIEAARGRRGPARVHWVAAQQALEGRSGTDARVLRARLAHKLGRHRDARAMLREVLAEAPDDPGARALAPEVLGVPAPPAPRGDTSRATAQAVPAAPPAGLFDSAGGAP